MAVFLGTVSFMVPCMPDAEWPMFWYGYVSLSPRLAGKLCVDTCVLFCLPFMGI